MAFLISYDFFPLKSMVMLYQAKPLYCISMSPLILTIVNFSGIALEKENKSLKLQVDFLKQQLEYKTFGKPNNLEEEE